MPRMIELIRASAVPSNLMQAAAKGALAVPAPEMLEILVHLAVHNRVFGEQARLTLAGWDEKTSLLAAADPKTQPEVLNYMASPDNFRPKLAPALFGNPSVSEESLLKLATAGGREVVDFMMKSERVQHLPSVLHALRSNPNLTGIQSENIDQILPPAETTAEVSAAPAVIGDTTADPPPDAAAGTEDGVDADVMAYLTEHAAEIATEGDKPFQAIGGVYDDLLEPDTAAGATPAAAGTTGTSTATAAKPGVQKKTFLTHDEERGSALQKISKLDIKGRIQLAMKGTKEERSILVRDGTKLVALSVLESPKISDGEVERFAAQKNVLEAVLRGIPMKRRFAKHYPVVRNLVFNPRTPLDVSLGLMKNILINDLRQLSGNKEVSDTVRKLALKMFKAKQDPSKKKTD